MFKTGDGFNKRLRDANFPRHESAAKRSADSLVRESEDAALTREQCCRDSATSSRLFADFPSAKLDSATIGTGIELFWAR
jgi:hypothetical protein